jgi:hypothetical protein
MKKHPPLSTKRRMFLLLQTTAQGGRQHDEVLPWGDYSLRGIPKARSINPRM